MERLKMIKDNLISVIQTQMGNLQEVDAKELGEVVDMVKDIEEAIYYCTITKAMQEQDEQKKKEEMYYTPRMYPRMMNEEDADQMYYGGGRGGMRNYPGQGWMIQDMGARSDGGANSNHQTHMYTEREYPGHIMRDAREGVSPMSRKTYMESQEMEKDEIIRMKDLNNYMMELSQDMTELIRNASPNEKNSIKQKLTELAGKIK